MTALAPFGLRMPPEIKAWVSRQAASNHRSMNSEIIFQLERAYAQKAAAGDEIGVMAPAAPINPGIGAS